MKTYALSAQCIEPAIHPFHSYKANSSPHPEHNCMKSLAELISIKNVFEYSDMEYQRRSPIPTKALQSK
jgi:hypothetical protein